MELSKQLSNVQIGSAISAPQFECQTHEGCAAFVHHWGNETLLLWSGTPDLTPVSGLTIAKHPLCMVKVQVFCGSNCPADLLDEKIPCRCPDGLWPTPRCPDGEIADAGADCADGKPPRDLCSDGSVCSSPTTTLGNTEAADSADCSWNTPKTCGLVLSMFFAIVF